MKHIIIAENYLVQVGMKAHQKHNNPSEKRQEYKKLHGNSKTKNAADLTAQPKTSRDSQQIQGSIVDEILKNMIDYQEKATISLSMIQRQSTRQGFKRIMNHIRVLTQKEDKANKLAEEVGDLNDFLSGLEKNQSYCPPNGLQFQIIRDENIRKIKQIVIDKTRFLNSEYNSKQSQLAALNMRIKDQKMHIQKTSSQIIKLDRQIEERECYWRDIVVQKYCQKGEENNQAKRIIVVLNSDIQKLNLEIEKGKNENRSYQQMLTQQQTKTKETIRREKDKFQSALQAKDIEVKDCMRKISQQQQYINSIKEQCKHLRQALNHSIFQKVEIQKELINAREKAARLGKKIDDSQKNDKNNRKIRQELEENIAEWRSQNERTRQILMQRQSQIQRMKENLIFASIMSKQQHEMQSYQSENRKRQLEYQQIIQDHENSIAQLKKIIQKRNECPQEQSQRAAIIKQQEDKIKLLQMDNKKMRDDWQPLLSRNSELEKEMHQRSREMIKLKREMEIKEQRLKYEIASFTNQISVLENRIKSTNFIVKDTRKQIQQSKQKITEYEKENIKLKDKITKLEETIESCNYQMDLKVVEIKEKVSQIQKMKKDEEEKDINMKAKMQEMSENVQRLQSDLKIRGELFLTNQQKSRELFKCQLQIQQNKLNLKIRELSDSLAQMQQKYIQSQAENNKKEEIIRNLAKQLEQASDCQRNIRLELKLKSQKVHQMMVESSRKEEILRTLTFELTEERANLSKERALNQSGAALANHYQSTISEKEEFINRSKEQTQRLMFELENARRRAEELQQQSNRQRESSTKLSKDLEYLARELKDAERVKEQLISDRKRAFNQIEERDKIIQELLKKQEERSLSGQILPNYLQTSSQLKENSKDEQSCAAFDDRELVDKMRAILIELAELLQSLSIGGDFQQATQTINEKIEESQEMLRQLESKLASILKENECLKQFLSANSKLFFTKLYTFSKQMI